MSEIDIVHNFLFLGTNLRMELPLLNTKIKSIYSRNYYNINLYSFGLALDYLTFPVNNIGNSSKSLLSLVEGRLKYNFIIFYTDFLNINYYSQNIIKKYNFFIGRSILNRIDSDNILFSFINLFNILNCYNLQQFNILPRFLGRITSYELNLLPGIYSYMLVNKLNTFSINHYCGVDIDIASIFKIKSKNINVYQGSFHINMLFKKIKIILPAKLFTEYYHIFYNLEGRFRLATCAIKSFPKIYSNSHIFHILLVIKKKLISSNFTFIKYFHYYKIFIYNIINYFYFSYKLKTVYSKLLIYKNIIINFLNFPFKNNK